MSTGHLIRTAVVDKNGKSTHVNKKPFSEPETTRPVAFTPTPSITAPMSKMETVVVGSEEWNVITDYSESGSYCMECETPLSEKNAENVVEAR